MSTEEYRPFESNIQYAHKVDMLTAENPWMTLIPRTKWKKIWFANHAVKIDDTIYFNDSPKFRDAYDKVRAWELLKK